LLRLGHLELNVQGFVTSRRPWISGAGKSSGSAPTLSVSSNTLSVTKSGTNYDVELVNEYATTAFANPLTVAAPGNFAVTMTGALTLDAPTGGVDGYTCNFKFYNTSGGALNLSLAGTIAVPSSSTFTSPQSIANDTYARLSLQYDGVAAAWALVQFINGYPT
jgi:hypothetical protein